MIPTSHPTYDYAPTHARNQVTDRWQKYTTFALNKESVAELSQYCDEFLVHGVEVEVSQSLARSVSALS